MAMAIVEPVSARAVTGGVDTHLDVHVAAALDDIGGLLGVESFEASRAGNDELLAWLRSFGDVTQVGVEGTGSYGASASRRRRHGGRGRPPQPPGPPPHQQVRPRGRGGSGARRAVGPRAGRG